MVIENTPISERPQAAGRKLRVMIYAADGYGAEEAVFEQFWKDCEVK